MRRQDWAFLVASITFVAALVALVAGCYRLSIVLVLVVCATSIAARRWSRHQPGPMSHALRWVLHVPRGAHSPRRLLGILQPLPGERILEIGSGIGIHTIPVAEAVAPTGEVDTIDIQQEMIATLRARAAAASVRNLAAVCADATKLPYGNGVFAAAFLISVLGEIPDADAGLAELRRVLAPNGRLIVGEIILDPDFVALGELQNRLERAGFALESKSGTRAAYLARFRRVDRGGGE